MMYCEGTMGVANKEKTTGTLPVHLAAPAVLGDTVVADEWWAKAQEAFLEGLSVLGTIPVPASPILRRAALRPRGRADGASDGSEAPADDARRP